MDFQQMLWEILAGQPKQGPMGPHGIPMSAPGPQGIQMPGPTTMGGRAPMPAQITPPMLPPGGGVGGSPTDAMATNPLWGGGAGPLPTPPGMAGSGMSPHAGPPGPSLLAGPQPAPQPQAGPGMVGAPQESFRNKAAGLFGGGQFNLANILADAMAGAAAGDPTAPPIKAFAQGFTGSRASKKLREESAKKEADDAEQKVYDRQGTDLDREAKREELGNTRKMAPLQRAKTAAEVKESLEYGRREKQLDAAALDAITRDELTPPDEKIAKIKEYLGMGQPQTQGQEWNPQSGTPPPKGYKRYNKSGGWIQWDGTQWVDEQGKPVPTS